MTSLEISIKDTILPVALANAALLITAPSLGCLSTYTRALNDLCQIYSIPSPNLTQVLQYNTRFTMSSSISPERPDETIKQELSEEGFVLEKSTATRAIFPFLSVNYDESLEVTQSTKDTEEPVCRINEECEEPMSKMIKQEVVKYKEMYMACRKPPHTKQDKIGIQPTNLNSHIRQNVKYFKQNDSEMPEVQPSYQKDQVETEIKPEILNDVGKSKAYPANQSTAIKFSVQASNQNDKVRSRVQPVNHNTTGQSKTQSAISKSSAEHHPNNAGIVMKTSNKKQCVSITSSYGKTSAQSKQVILFSYLLPDGNLIEEIEKIHHEIMPVKYLAKDAVLKVHTFVKGSKKSSPGLNICIRNNHDLRFSFLDIEEIESNGNDCIVNHYMLNMHRIQCVASITATGEIRSAEENKKSLLDWLLSFIK